MKPGCGQDDVNHVVELLDVMGLCGWVVAGPDRTAVEVLGANGQVDRQALADAPMVECVVQQCGPILAAGRNAGDQRHVVPLGASASVGGPSLAIIAGPCSVESFEQLLDIALAVKQAGAVGIRGGAFKPRTSPYCFQGHGERGLEWLARVREETGLAVVTEVMRCEHVKLVARYADVLQVGSRNMHNTHLLSEVGKQDKPILLKRGWSATLEEFLWAAEYIMLQGNRDVILCERGIRTHETYVRNTLALAIVPEIKHISNLPIIVDPSHGTGRSHLVTPMSYAATACGADGLIVEVHQNPKRAWTDGAQSLTPAEFHSLMKELKPFTHAANREL
ncbi:MAG: 3-deoxy-7-phosphoheptulonate synthase [Phycisphaerae bacterium]